LILFGIHFTDDDDDDDAELNDNMMEYRSYSSSFFSLSLRPLTIYCTTAAVDQIEGGCAKQPTAWGYSPKYKQAS